MSDVKQRCKVNPDGVCKKPTYCKCYMLALEPNESCPVHGYPIPRCECGRFMKYNLELVE